MGKGSEALETPSEGKKFTRIGDNVYDITDFINKHPGGADLLSLAVDRDATIMFDTYHFRTKVVNSKLSTLPIVKDYSIPKVDYPYPSESPLYQAIVQRIVNEVKEPLRGSQEMNIVIILSTAFIVYSAYLYAPSVPVAILLGLVGSWWGLTLNHAGNHGSLTVSPFWNTVFGMADDIIGGSSLVWRYHHHVSHHAYTNDAELDQDVHSSYPVIRLDEKQDYKWHHKYQQFYCWLLFPLLFISIHMDDTKAFLAGRTYSTKFSGATKLEYGLFVLGKLLHFTLLLFIPTYFYSSFLSALFYYCVFGATGSLVLGTLFIVSHNTPETKEEDGKERDWAVMNIEHSCSWGGDLATFLTGGLNMQIEHHVFPSANPMLYPKFRKIIEEECNKQGVRYSYYKTFPEVLVAFFNFMAKMGEEPKKVKPGQRIK